MALQVWLPLNGNLNNNGVGNPTISCNATVDNAGKIGKCYVCASGNHISFTNPITTSTTDFAISCWIYVTEYTSGYSNVFSSRTATSGKGLALWVTSSSIRFDDGEMWTISNTFTLNTWTHICVTYSKTKGKEIYVNGNLIGSKATVGTLANLRSELFIGYDHYGYYLGGKINDLRIWGGSTPSPKEVEILSRGLVLHYPLCDPYVEDTSNLCNVQYISAGTSGSWGGHSGVVSVVDSSNFNIPCVQCNKLIISYSGSGGGGFGRGVQNITVSTSTIYTCSFYFKTSENFTSPNLGNLIYLREYNSSGTQIREAGIWSIGNKEFVGDGWYRLWGTFTTQSSTVKIQPCVYVYPCSDQEYYFGCWQVEQKDHMTPYILESRSERITYDTSGYCYNGTNSNSLVISADTTRYSVSTHFVSGSYIMSNDNCLTMLPTDAITVNIWVKPTTWGTPISCTEGGGWNFEDIGGGLQFQLYISNGVGYKPAKCSVTGASLQDGKWHMLTGTFSKVSQETKLYIDGQLKATTATGSPNEIGYANNRLIISGEAQSTTPASAYFVGEESDLRIYATALTATQIAELYNTSTSISNN